MSGRPEEEGQLALMDAIVFFLAAMVVSGVLFSTVAERVEDDVGSWFDSKRALEAILRSSLGSEIEVSICGEQLEINERTEIAECVLLEAHVIAEGDDRSEFGALNSRLAEVIDRVCGPSMHGRLRVCESQNGAPHELFSIPRDWTEAGIAYASTAELADPEGRVFLVQLCSAPAAGLEPS